LREGESMISYKDTGVDIEEGYRAVKLIKGHAERTFIPGVMNNIGSFAGMFELAGYKKPVLISGTDGVGTKLDIAFRMKRYDTIGIDCVAMCVNDILCHGARPLFFLDYIACGKLDSLVAKDIVKGVADGCVEAGCALIGGETAEMPGFYRGGEYDIAGFVVGVVEKSKIIDGKDIKSGDILIGLESSGLHSNGYSLVRTIINDFDMNFGWEKIGNVLLTPTRIYVKTIQKLLESYKIKGMSHITGGGFYENIPRMFKGELTAVVYRNSFHIHDIFKYIMSLGVSESEMFNTFNMGIGFVICVGQKDAADIVKTLEEMGERAHILGHIEAGGAGLCLE
jgi:phosphoribosylformylglycinamidine cyclo-ligase